MTKSVPKTELHVHVEAIIQLETLKEFAKRYKLESKKVETLEHAAKNGYENIEGFFGYWHLLNNSLQKASDFERIVFEYLEEVSSYNVKYVELNLNVLRQKEKGIDPRQIIYAIYMAQRQAESQFGIFSRLILSFSRDFSTQEGKYIVDLAEEYKDQNVCGVDIAGNEKAKPNIKFIEIFQYAKSKNINRTAHAGEGALQDSIRDAVLNLEVSRIGHGVDAALDDDIMDLLLEKQICVELCPTSNIELGFVDSIETHPGKIFIDKRIPVTINSDDPTLLGVSIQDEYDLLTESWNLSEEDLLQIYRNGVEYAFVEDEVKEELLKYT